MDNRPPTDIDAVSLVSLMKERPRPSAPVEWPGGCPVPGYEKIRVIIPPEVEYTKARIAAHLRMKEQSRIPFQEWESPLCNGILNDLVGKEMLARCLYRDKPIPGSEELTGRAQYPKLFANSEDVERALGKDEIHILYTQFLMIEHRLGPRLKVLTEADIDAWIERLKEGSDPLALLALPDWVELILGFHRRLAASTGTPNRDSQPKSSPTTSGSAEPTSFATDIFFSGEPLV